MGLSPKAIYLLSRKVLDRCGARRQADCESWVVTYEDADLRIEYYPAEEELIAYWADADASIDKHRQVVMWRRPMVTFYERFGKGMPNTSLINENRATAQNICMQRGGHPGHELDDWLAAERQVLAERGGSGGEWEIADGGSANRHNTHGYIVLRRGPWIEYMQELLEQWRASIPHTRE